MAVDDSAAESSSSPPPSNSLGEEQQRREQQQHVQERTGSCVRGDDTGNMASEMFRCTKRMKTPNGSDQAAAKADSMGTSDVSSSNRSFISYSKRPDAYSSAGHLTETPESGKGK
jgi:hypothetical protein